MKWDIVTSSADAPEPARRGGARNDKHIKMICVVVSGVPATMPGGMQRCAQQMDHFITTSQAASRGPGA
jgi:hypothetical protein